MKYDGKDASKCAMRGLRGNALNFRCIVPAALAVQESAGGSGGTVQISTGARASAELDIRGLETLEAESVVENYLDAAQRSKLGTVTIIHGKGTGALRAAVHQMLKKNRAVKSFRLGRYGEGESGVTVVEFK